MVITIGSEALFLSLNSHRCEVSVRTIRAHVRTLIAIDRLDCWHLPKEMTRYKKVPSGPHLKRKVVGVLS
jgi:hypothetical protein